jgi:hypothetical protein
MNIDELIAKYEKLLAAAIELQQTHVQEYSEYGTQMRRLAIDAYRTILHDLDNLKQAQKN